MKVFNIRGIITFIIILLAVQLVGGLVLSPMLGPVIEGAINKTSDAKISIGKIHVWPITFSCSLKDLKVYDPDNEKEIMALIEKASIRISFIALLSKRIVIADLKVSGAEIDVRTEPDGSFNVQKLAPKGEEEAKPQVSVWDRLKGKEDWFGRVYRMIKNRASKKPEDRKEEEKERKVIKKKVEELPRGRRVRFTSLSDEYIFQIRNFVITNSKLKLYPAKEAELTVADATVVMKNLGVDPLMGARFDKLNISGKLQKEGAPAGSFEFLYNQAYKWGQQRMDCRVSAKNIDLAAVRFVYEDSLPVVFNKGQISLNSSTTFTGENIDSSNSIVLKDQDVAPTSKSVLVGVVPLPMICQALNQVNPAKFKFTITGTVDNPQFGGFQEALMELVKPYLTNITESLKEKAVDKLTGLLKKETGDTSTGAPASDAEDLGAKAADALKSLFNKDK